MHTLAKNMTAVCMNSEQ